jgi:hypothetical protein
MRAKLTLPELLLVVATAVMMYGTSRLYTSARSPHPPLDVRRYLIVWYVLLVGGICLWLVTAFRLW